VPPQPGQVPTDVDERTVITNAVPVSSTLSMTTPGGIKAVGLNLRAMLPIPLLTRRAGTRTSAKLSQTLQSTPSLRATLVRNLATNRPPTRSLLRFF
jgi:hypothetical protein